MCHFAPQSSHQAGKKYNPHRRSAVPRPVLPFAWSRRESTCARHHSSANSLARLVLLISRTNKSGYFPRPAKHTPFHLKLAHQRRPAASQAASLFSLSTAPLLDNFIRGLGLCLFMETVLSERWRLFTGIHKMGLS